MQKNKFKTKISKKNQEKIFQKRKTKFPPAKINSLNTQIMTFADRHTYTQLHDIHTYTCQNNFSNCQNNFPTKNFENKKC